MRNKIVTWVILVVIDGLFLCLTHDCLGSPQQQKASNKILKNGHKARALYDKMIEAIRKAETLSYESNYREEVNGEQGELRIYRVWMKKPYYFYVETVTKDNKKRGILIGDGRYAWSYWPNGRPWFKGEDYDAYKKSRLNVYMKESAGPDKYSIGHAKVMAKSNCLPILDPSVFQEINDPLEPVIDWVRILGVEKVDNEDCNVIEVSYMNHQRSHHFWISRRDNLPRKLKSVVRVSDILITQEVWSKVTLNAEIPMEKFRWTLPEGWKQWYPPGPEDKLLKIGQQAPDFELSSADRSKMKLSNFRGKIIWLNFWRVGCPPCREEIPYLEKLHRKFKSKGLVVIGFDFADNRQIALDFLHQNSVTFSNILDTSEEAVKTGFMTYGATAAPVNYIIDRKGKISAAWLGYDENSEQGVDVLKNLGLK